MKNRYCPWLAGLSMMFIVLAATPVVAQEGSPINETPELYPYPDASLKEEKPLLSEPEGKVSTNTLRETVITPSPSKSKTKNSDSKPTATGKAEEDALSFNFLYYIIQKFKISDIVDQ